MSSIPHTFSSLELENARTLTPSISGPSESSRFIQYCIDYFAQWQKCSKGRIESGAIAHDQATLIIYTLDPKVTTGIKEFDGIKLKQSYKSTYSIESGVFCSNQSLHTVCRIPVEHSSSDDLIEFVQEKIASDQTFVILLMTKGIILVHNAGEPIDDWINSPSAVPVSGTTNEISLKSVDEQLIRYQHAHTSTHRAYTARLMWRHDSAGRPRLTEKPELQVQTTLLTHLKAWYQNANVIVQEEISNPGGRVDIQMTRPSSNGITLSTIELKILKPNLNEKENIAWAEKGIDQAKGYIAPESDFSMTCLFDARIEKSPIFSPLNEYAAKAKVELRTFSMTPPPVKEAKEKKPRSSKAKKTSAPPPSDKSE